jgi:16S rRNA G966 N2-methylase RsmD
MKMTQYLKWKADPSKGEVFTPIGLVKEMLDKIPEEVWRNPDSVFLDPCMGKGTFLIEIVDRLTYIYGYTEKDAKSRVYGYDIRVKYINYLQRRGFINVRHKDFLNEIIKMKFDVVLGNPPFQDGTKKGGQNKIYLDITKQSLSLLKDDGILCFITPTSILKNTKRFSLVGVEGLKFVDFNTDDYFKQGIKICSWMVDKKHEGDINVIIKDKMIQSPKGEMIYNFIENEGIFFKIYQKLKEITKSPKDRMFLQNPVDTKTGRNFVQDEIFQYPVHKIQKGEKIVVQYNKPTPKLYGQNKFIIPITKGFLEESTFTDIDDYDVAHLFLRINNNEELSNVKSFIFSEYFIEHVNKWKKMDGYGYNYALKHLPKFDINKHWTSEEVKTFIESYVE